MTTIKVNRYWWVTKHGPCNYTANRPAVKGTAGVLPCEPEVRFYFSREAVERDFGRLDFNARQSKGD
jgi:hypothetical protein